MDEHTYANWVKVKETFEASGNTDNFFYKRACAIVRDRKDPLDNFIGGDKK
jgi:ribosomal protein S19E (S16A)